MVLFYATIHYFSLVSNLLFIDFGLFFRHLLLVNIIFISNCKTS